MRGRRRGAVGVFGSEGQSGNHGQGHGQLGRKKRGSCREDDDRWTPPVIDRKVRGLTPSDFHPGGPWAASSPGLEGFPEALFHFFFLLFFFCFLICFISFAFLIQNYIKLACTIF
jgi:hypothetical protein